MPHGSLFDIEVHPRLPERLAWLETFANDLHYSWERDLRGLFRQLDDTLYDACNHNPRVFLRQVSQQVLDAAADDRAFLRSYDQVRLAYDAYRARGLAPRLEPLIDPDQDLIAYFCLEFGLHESMPLYSGGLGILAGDHCKASSDLGLPLVAVGLLYRQGYFRQTIDRDGNQIAHYVPNRIEDLPIRRVLDADGQEIRVEVPLADRTLVLCVWEAIAGHTRLLFLDSDIPENDGLRNTTYQLYGGDREMRIRQELALGIGGVAALERMGLSPSVYHINEGHAAFLIPARCARLVDAGLGFETALELVAASTVFTTHTPVAAGHDVFEPDLAERHLQPLARRLNIPLERMLALGNGHDAGGFNMTALALRGSRIHNGVSRVHRGVSAQLMGYIWPQIDPAENPLEYVTNGVHVQTFLSHEWVHLFDARFPDWASRLPDHAYWDCLDDITDRRFWGLRQDMKMSLRHALRERALRQHRRNGLGEASIRKAIRHLNDPSDDILLLGFARRFASYKRAGLLFSDPDRLARLLCNPERPVVLIMAGKAHPHDQEGQALIREIHALSMREDLIGHVILLEGYDLALGRALVGGVDVWVNTPEYPMEASGTSGQKAGINGAINLSILDGWWAEGYDGTNGWAIAPQVDIADAARRQRLEAEDLLELLEDEIVPLYFDRGTHGYSEGWVRIARDSMKTLIPRYNAVRMVTEYVERCYAPARDNAARLAADGAAKARELADWKHRVLDAWPRVSAHRDDTPLTSITTGESLRIAVVAKLAELTAHDVVVEALIADNDALQQPQCYRLEPVGTHDGGTWFELNLVPPFAGKQYYRLRMYPYHVDLTHPFELGRMIWL